MDPTHVRCRVLTPGKLGSRRHINLPGVDVNLPSLTEKDERDIRAGVAGWARLRGALVRPQGRGRPGAAAPARPSGLEGAHHRQDRGPGRPAQPARHRQGRRRGDGGARRSGDRDRLPHAAARADADRRPVPDRGQAGDHRHAPAGVDDLARRCRRARRSPTSPPPCASAPTRSCSRARRRPGFIRSSASR